MVASSTPLQLRAQIANPLRGHVTAPGDKSISHRALILGALAEGLTEITGLLEGADIMATKDAMVAFGAAITRKGEGAWSVEGRGSFSEPEGVVDCGNAGTGVRLIMGAAAGFALSATFTGDHSLIKRPMGRVLDPLSQMGVSYLSRSKGRLPLTMQGGALKAIAYRLPVASAQVKSALLLAGLNAEGVTEISWSGGNLPDEFYDEFVFRGTLAGAEAGTEVYFPVVQTCASGEEAWIEIPAKGQPEPELPAPGLKIIEATGGSH